MRRISYALMGLSLMMGSGWIGLNGSKTEKQNLSFAAREETPTPISLEMPTESISPSTTTLQSLNEQWPTLSGDLIMNTLPNTLEQEQQTATTSLRGVPLEEAKKSGVWYKWEGCVSKYGDPSPSWLAYALDKSGWPRSGWDKVCRVIGCESRFKPDAHGGLQGRMWFLLQGDIKSWFVKGYDKLGVWVGGKWHLWFAPEMSFTHEEMLSDPVIQLTWFRALFNYINQTRGTEEVWYGDQWTCNRA